MPSNTPEARAKAAATRAKNKRLQREADELKWRRREKRLDAKHRALQRLIVEVNKALTRYEQRGS